MQVQGKKKIILAALLCLLAGYWVFALFIKGSGAPAPAARTAAPAAGKRQQGPPMAAIKVDLYLLEKPRPAYNASKNIFSPVYKKPELVKPPQPPSAGKPGQPPITVTPLPPLPPPPPPKSQAEIDAENAREEMKKIRVLGFLKRKDRTDVFVSLGAENFVVARGGKITKEYYVTDIGKDFVLLSDKFTGVEVRVSTESSKEGSKTVSPPGVPGGGSSGAPPQPVQFPGGGRMGPGPGGPPQGPRHFNPSQGTVGELGIAPSTPTGQAADPLKNYSIR
jgi:hypothetical protein